MTRLSFLKAAGKRFAPILVCLALAVYTYSQLLGTTSAGLVTTTVKPITDTQKISGEAYLFRGEKVLVSSAPGVVEPLVSDGQKVSRGTKVAKVWTDYAGTEIEKKQTELKKLNDEIAILTDSKISAGSSYSNLSVYRQSADEHFTQLKKSVAKGDCQAAAELADSLRIDLNRVENLLDSDFSPESVLEELKAEKSGLLQGNSETLVSSDSSAYFYGAAFVDGYENLYTSDLLNNLTSEKLEELKNASPESTENVAGKLVFGYEWSLAILLDAGSEAIFSEGVLCRMTFPESRNASFTMTLRSVSAESDSVIAVFTCNRDPSDFSYLRVQTVEISVGETYGLYIPESALVTNADGQIGVYIFESNTALFRPVRVLYRGDGYVIAAEGEELALNDLVITSGRDLYDGRTY